MCCSPSTAITNRPPISQGWASDNTDTPPKDQGWANEDNGSDSNSQNPTDENKRGNPPTVTGPPDILRHRNLRLLPTACGTYEGDRILGGNRTMLYEYPWMVLIAYNSRK